MKTLNLIAQNLIVLSLTLMTVAASAASNPFDTPVTGAPLAEVNYENSQRAFLVLQDFEQTKQFRLTLQTPRGLRAFTVTAFVAGRYEPDAPAPTHLLALRENDYSVLFETGAVIVREIQQVGNQIVIRGVGRPERDEQHCKGWTQRRLEFVIEAVMEPGAYMPTLRYSKVTESTACP